MGDRSEFNFICEIKLKKESPTLHRLLTESIAVLPMLLNKYKGNFPEFTDHTILHSVEVIEFMNKLIGENVVSLNVDEIYILLMAAYLHDIGMGVSLKDYERFKENIPMEPDALADPNEKVTTVIRRYHHEFSGEFIKKYAPLFDIPSAEHLFAIVQVSRGHRKTDLYDENEYPATLTLPNGNTVCLPYLAALIRLADELDIAADRNLSFLYDVTKLTDHIAIVEYKKHIAIKHLSIDETEFTMQVDSSDEMIFDEVKKLMVKLHETLDYCRDVVAKRTPYTISQKEISIVPIP